MNILGFELNIELNHFLAKVDEKINNHNHNKEVKSKKIKCHHSRVVQWVKPSHLVKKISKIGQKKTNPLKDLKWLFWPFSGLCQEFLHVHICQSGAQTIHFKVSNPTAKLQSKRNRSILLPKPTLHLSLFKSSTADFCKKNSEI